MALSGRSHAEPFIPRSHSSFRVNNPIFATAASGRPARGRQTSVDPQRMSRSGKREVFIFRISSCDERSQTLTPQTCIIVAVGRRMIEAAVPEPVTPEPGNVRVSFFSGRAMKSLTLARSCTLHPQLRRTSRALRSGLVLLGSKDVSSSLISGRSIPLSSTCSSVEEKPLKQAPGSLPQSCRTIRRPTTSRVSPPPVMHRWSFRHALDS